MVTERVITLPRADRGLDREISPDIFIHKYQPEG